jgi:hypothetical protein
MTSKFSLGLVLMAMWSAPALAQGDRGKSPAPATPPTTPTTPTSATPAGAPAKEPERLGDPYPLDTCPITGKKLGEMGDPVVKLYEGREVRFCCPACAPKFEKDKAGNLAKLDEKIVKDQLPLYPLKTSVVTGKSLPEKAYDYVYGNRLVRLDAEGEKAEFLKDPKKHLAALDKAVVAAQGKDYPLAACPVSKEKLGGMGPAVDVVVGGRLIRMCCDMCKADVEKSPSKFIALVDAARKGTGKGDASKDGEKDKAGGGAGKDGSKGK